jgi:RNA recognition motif-containing protein
MDSSILQTAEWVEKLYIAQIAKEKMNGATIMGSKIRVMNKGENLTMNKDCIVMISNIDPAMTHEEFESMCTKYGQVKNLKYTTDINDTFTNRAVVCFSSPEEAAACVNGLHSTKIKDKIVVASLNNKSSKILVVKGDIEKAKVDEIRKKLEVLCPL